MDYTGFHSMPIHLSDGYNLYVDGAPAQLTGAFATLLHRPFVKRMKIPLHDTPFSSAAVNLRERDVQVARIRRLSVGSGCSGPSFCNVITASSISVIGACT